MNVRTLPFSPPLRCSALLLTLALGLAGCQSNPVRPHHDLTSADEGLFTWVDQELTPYLAEQLTRHPRFKGEPVLVVAMSGADVLPDIDRLSDTLRSRIMDSLLETSGVNLLWRPTVRPWRHHRRPERADCRDQSEVHYYLGIEISPVPGGQTRVRVRALDLRDESWVTGFGKHWQGTLSTAQSLARSQRHPDEYLRGLRVLPFTAEQPDLLAAYLAGNLSCLLRGHGDEERLVHLVLSDEAGDPTLRTTLELVGNYLARYRTVRLTDDANRANLDLKGKRHTIHSGLHQVWASLHSRAEGGRVDTAAYVSAVPEQGDLTDSSHRQPEPPSTPSPMLSGLRLVSPGEAQACDSGNAWRGPVRYLPSSSAVAIDGCVAVEIQVSNAARLFLLSHRSDTGLRRVFPANCRDTASYQRPGGTGTRFRIPAVRGERERDAEPGLETFYAIAVSGPRLRGEMEAHMRHLDSECEPGWRATGAAEDDWLARLDELIETHPAEADWQALRVRYQP